MTALETSVRSKIERTLARIRAETERAPREMARVILSASSVATAYGIADPIVVLEDAAAADGDGRNATVIASARARLLSAEPPWRAFVVERGAWAAVNDTKAIEELSERVVNAVTVVVLHDEANRPSTIYVTVAALEAAVAASNERALTVARFAAKRIASSGRALTSDLVFVATESHPEAPVDLSPAEAYVTYGGHDVVREATARRRPRTHPLLVKLSTGELVPFVLEELLEGTASRLSVDGKEEISVEVDGDRFTLVCLQNVAEWWIYWTNEPPPGCMRHLGTLCWAYDREATRRKNLALVNVDQVDIEKKVALVERVAAAAGLTLRAGEQ